MLSLGVHRRVELYCVLSLGVLAVFLGGISNLLADIEMGGLEMPQEERRDLRAPPKK
jgi:hypothetical protein